MSVDLWQATLTGLYELSDSITREPWPKGRDRGRVAEVFGELYLLGEHPTSDQVRGYLNELAPSRRWAREVSALWAERLRKPLYRPAELASGGCQWVHPFYLLDTVATRHGLQPIRNRLLAALSNRAADYLDRAERDPDTEATAFAWELVEATVYALGVFGETRDKRGHPDWGSAIRARSRQSPYARMYADHVERWRRARGRDVT